MSDVLTLRQTQRDRGKKAMGRWGQIFIKLRNSRSYQELEE